MRTKVGCCLASLAKERVARLMLYVRLPCVTYIIHRCELDWQSNNNKMYYDLAFTHVAHTRTSTQQLETALFWYDYLLVQGSCA